MNVKLLGVTGLLLLMISRIMLAFGADFLYAQQPVDWAHWLMLTGAVLVASFNFIFPKSIFNTLASILTILGVIAHIGMCTIDFALWSFGDDHSSRNELVGQLINTPSIWYPFIVVGPAMLYAGLATHAWKFILSHTLSAIMTIGGSFVIGLGQLIWNDMVIVVFGFVVFSIGLVLLAYRQEISERFNIKYQIKKNKSYLIGATLLLVAVYGVCRIASNRISERKHQEWVESLTSTASKHVNFQGAPIYVQTVVVSNPRISPSGVKPTK